MIFDDKTLYKTLEDFRHKHAEMVDCLICRAVESMPWQDIELVITHEADGSTVRVRQKPHLKTFSGGVSKDLFDSVCAERDALYEEVSELKRSRDDAPTVYFLPGPDSWTDERIHGVTHSAKVIDIKKLSEF